MKFRMDKKNIVIGVISAAFGFLALEYSQLRKDHIDLINVVKQSAEQIEIARDIIVDKVFEDIVEHYDQ